MTEFKDLLCALQKNSVLMEVLLTGGFLSGGTTTSKNNKYIAISSERILLSGLNTTLNYPSDADIAYLQLQEGEIIYKVDGTIISNGEGHTFKKRQGFIFFKDLNKIRLVNSSLTAKVFVTYYKDDI